MNRAEQILIEKLESAHLEVIDICGNTSSPTVDEAWRKMANVNTLPSATVPCSLKESHAEVNRIWFDQVESGGIFGPSGSFLVTAVTTGSGDVGWVRVQCTEGTDMSRLTDDQDGIEFIARSEDGSSICGVTTEEYDYWIVNTSFA
ncbi:hypothetical protein [Streptomyces sp. S186]|uniref:hypothetical protein n=1 Tax=Streptomyces sp. S186 TaxID=3434395 RepID=UPI003F67EB00